MAQLQNTTISDELSVQKITNNITGQQCYIQLGNSDPAATTRTLTIASTSGADGGIRFTSGSYSMFFWSTSFYPSSGNISLGSAGSNWTNVYTDALTHNCTTSSGNDWFLQLNANTNYGSGVDPVSTGFLFSVQYKNSSSAATTATCRLQHSSSNGVLFYPQNSSGTNNLGTTYGYWSNIYCKNGTINTSQRSEKSHIHYVDEVSPARKSTSIDQDKVFTTEELISFIRKLHPATFTYKSNGQEISPSDAISSNNTELLSLGLIADDIKDEELFNYVGATMEYSYDTSEEVDEDGNVIQEHEEKQIHTLGLQVLPLTVAALTACKNLISRVEQLEQQLS